MDFRRVSLARIQHMALSNVKPWREDWYCWDNVGASKFTLNLRSVISPEGRKFIKIRVLLAQKEGRHGSGWLTNKGSQNVFLWDNCRMLPQRVDLAPFKHWSPSLWCYRIWWEKKEACYRERLIECIGFQTLKQCSQGKTENEYVLGVGLELTGFAGYTSSPSLKADVCGRQSPPCSHSLEISKGRTDPCRTGMAKWPPRPLFCFRYFWH